MSLDSHTTTQATTFRDATRRVTTFQRASLRSEGETFDVPTQIIGRRVPVRDALAIDERWPVYENLTRAAVAPRRRFTPRQRRR